MTQRWRPRLRWILRGCLASLTVLAALLAPADSRAQPLFRNEVLPESVAALATGASFAPAFGPWCCLVAVRAGADPIFAAWDLNGPMTTRPGRQLVGAETLLLNGFSAAPGLPTGLFQLGTLQVGDYTPTAVGRGLDCWRLVDTDQFRPLPPQTLERGRIRDGTAIATGSLDTKCFEQILTQSNYTSARAFRAAARRDLTYAQIFADPQTYRGQPVHLEGPLRELSHEEPPLECRADGVNDLYVAWILNEDSRELFCFQSTELPPSLAPYVGEEGKRKLKSTTVRVAAEGYFYKKFRYKAPDPRSPNDPNKNITRDAPVFIGHSLRPLTVPGEGTEADEWGRGMLAVFLGIVAFGVVVVVGLTWWFRYSDHRVRGRVNAVRDVGFIPPPPEETVPAAGRAEPPPPVSENNPETNFDR